MPDVIGGSAVPGPPRRVCPRCGGEVEAGCLLGPSFAPFGNTRHANEVGWYEGPARETWLGPRLPARGYTVTAVRCTACGLLELFAI